MSREEEIFRQNYRRCFDRCVRFARSFVFDKAEAEAIASDALMVLWQKRGDGGVDFSAPLPFLFGVVRNKALNYLRGRLREQNALGKQESIESKELALRIETLETSDPAAHYGADVQDIIRRTLSSLGEKTETAFRLSRFEGMSYKEIAKFTGASEKTVEYHVSRALRELRKKLKDYLPLIGIFLGLG